MAKRKAVDSKALAKLDQSTEVLLRSVKRGDWTGAIKICERIDRNDEARKILARQHR